MEKWFTAGDAFPLYLCVNNVNKTNTVVFSLMVLGRAQNFAELNWKLLVKISCITVVFLVCVGEAFSFSGVLNFFLK